VNPEFLPPRSFGCMERLVQARQELLWPWVINSEIVPTIFGYPPVPFAGSTVMMDNQWRSSTTLGPNMSLPSLSCYAYWTDIPRELSLRADTPIGPQRLSLLHPPIAQTSVFPSGMFINPRTWPSSTEEFRKSTISKIITIQKPSRYCSDLSTRSWEKMDSEELLSEFDDYFNDSDEVVFIDDV